MNKQDLVGPSTPDDRCFEKFYDTKPLTGRFLILVMIPLPPKVKAQWDRRLYHEADLGKGGDKWFMAVKEGMLMFRVETKNPNRTLRSILFHKRYSGAIEMKLTIVPPKECSLFNSEPPREFWLKEPYGIEALLGLEAGSVPRRPPRRKDGK